MQISNALKHYVKQSIHVSGSNVIITDFQKIQLIETLYSQSIEDYLLSDNLKDLLHKWANDNVDYSKLCLMLNSKDCFKILEHEEINYCCQLIFPIVTRKGIEGLLILYRTFGNYIESSVKAVESFRKFVNQFIDDSYEERG